MFFDPSLAQYEEEEAVAAVEEAVAAAPPPPPPPAEEPAVEALVEATSEVSIEKKPPSPAPSEIKIGESTGKVLRDATTRVVSTIERVQVELQASSVPGDKETISLGDGRVVEFTVPQNFNPGDVIEVEVGRKAYKDETPVKVTRDQLATFFATGVTTMSQPAVRASLGDRGNAVRPGPQLIELQQQGFDSMGIAREVGCLAASQISQDYPGDAELLALQKEFMMTAQREYIHALEQQKPSKLERRAPMPRAVILEFFDACNTKMQMPDVQEKLAAFYKEKKEMPNALIIETQRDMLETMGFERDHACECLNKMSSDFPNDEHLSQAMRQWAGTAQQACKFAMMQSEGADLQPDSKQMKDMAVVEQSAKARLAQMDFTARSSFLDKMRKKVEIFQKLSAGDRLRYVTKLPDDEKIKFVMSQILLMEQFQQQMQRQQANAP